MSDKAAYPRICKSLKTRFVSNWTIVLRLEGRLGSTPAEKHSIFQLDKIVYIINFVASYLATYRDNNLIWYWKWLIHIVCNILNLNLSMGWRARILIHLGIYNLIYLI